MLREIKDVIGAAWRVMLGKDAASQPKTVKKEQKKAQVTHLRQLEREKQRATEQGEPWVAIVDMDIDYENLSNGNFELDWNDQFIAQLMRFGYQGKTDADLVDQWFNDVCRNVVLETYEQHQAMQTNYSDIGNGRREYR